MAKHTNEKFKKILLEEVKQGVFTNASLKWFVKIYEIESANNDNKFGKFWNLIINKSDKFKVIDESETKDIRLRLLDIEKINLNEVFIDGYLYMLKEGTNRTLIKKESIFNGGVK